MEPGFEKMDKIQCAVESIDALVYGSLVKQGCSKTAKKFLKERNQNKFLDLKSIALKDSQTWGHALDQLSRGRCPMPAIQLDGWQTDPEPDHTTVAIWTFTFHEKSGFA